MNSLPKFNKRKRNPRARTRPNSNIKIGDWVLSQDESGRLLIEHSSGESIILATPPTKNK